MTETGPDRDADPVTLEQLADRAATGDALALEEFVGRVKDDVYNLAMRMLGHPADAEDATQEILVRVVTGLGSFRGEARLRTWIWRVAANHLLGVRRGRREPETMGFDVLAGMLEAGLAAGVATAVPPPDVDRQLLEEEVKLGCTSLMLACLDREHRLAFILGDVFGLTGSEAADVLAIEPAAFRQRLSRARRRMRSFMLARCGLVNQAAACRCDRQIEPSIAGGMLDPSHLVLAVHSRRAADDPILLQQYRAIESVHGASRVFRGHPAYVAPNRLVDRLRDMVAASPG